MEEVKLVCATIVLAFIIYGGIFSMSNAHELAKLRKEVKELDRKLDLILKAESNTGT